VFTLLTMTVCATLAQTLPRAFCILLYLIILPCFMYHFLLQLGIMIWKSTLSVSLSYDYYSEGPHDPSGRAF